MGPCRLARLSVVIREVFEGASVGQSLSNDPSVLSPVVEPGGENWSRSVFSKTRTSKGETGREK